MSRMGKFAHVYTRSVPIRRFFFWPVPVFGGKPENSERHFGVILFCFGVVFLCFGVAFLLCSRLLACVMFLVKTQKNTEWRSRYILPGDFFLHRTFTSFISVPKELGLWFHMAVVHNSILKKAVDEELSLNEL